MEATLFDERDYCKMYSNKVFTMRQRGESLRSELSSISGINLNTYINDIGNVYWSEDLSLEDNINYLLSLCSDNFNSALYATTTQIKSERDKNVMEQFIEMVGLSELFKQFKQQQSEDRGNTNNAIMLN